MRESGAQPLSERPRGYESCSIPARPIPAGVLASLRHRGGVYGGVAAGALAERFRLPAVCGNPLQSVHSPRQVDVGLYPVSTNGLVKGLNG